MSNSENYIDLSPLLLQARDVKTSITDLEFLSKSEYDVVRGEVALNQNTPNEILKNLSLDKSHYIQNCLTRRRKKDANEPLIHPTAIISKKAKIASDVSVGPYSLIYDNVIINEGTIIESHCEIGHPTTLFHHDMPPLVINKNSYIRSHSIFYEGSSLGENLVTGHRVTVREKTKAGRNFQIGTLGDIQGSCEIGDFVRFHSNIFIPQYSTIGDYVWIFPFVVLTNDPHPPSHVQMGVRVESYAVIATGSVVLPGITVGKDSLVGAHSLVSKDVKPNTVVAGSPAKYICDTNKIKLRDTGESAYPWRKHFHRGYLPEDISRWLSEFSKTSL